MLPTSKVSNIMPSMEGGALPFKVKGLYLSKLDCRVGGTKTIAPPLGATGLTCEKCEKPAG